MKRDEAAAYARGAGRLSSICIVTLPRFIDHAKSIEVSQVPVKFRLIDNVGRLLTTRYRSLVLHVSGKFDDIALLFCGQQVSPDG